MATASNSFRSRKNISTSFIVRRRGGSGRPSLPSSKALQERGRAGENALKEMELYARIAGALMRIIGFAGWSGSGKTTLIVKLNPPL